MNTQELLKGSAAPAVRSIAGHTASVKEGKRENGEEAPPWPEQTNEPPLKRFGVYVTRAQRAEEGGQHTSWSHSRACLSSSAARGARTKTGFPPVDTAHRVNPATSSSSTTRRVVRQSVDWHKIRIPTNSSRAIYSPCPRAAGSSVCNALMKPTQGRGCIDFFSFVPGANHTRSKRWDAGGRHIFTRVKRRRLYLNRLPWGGEGWRSRPVIPSVCHASGLFPCARGRWRPPPVRVSHAAVYLLLH